MQKYDQIVFRNTSILLLSVTLGACSFGSKRDAAPKHHVNVATIPDAVPRVEPKSRGGNPKSYVVFGKTYYVMNSSHGYVERGIASWYGTAFHGKKTSNGETYSMYQMTAAHKSLPLPTYVQVKNLKNGKSIVVRVNDRGPFHHNRIIDLSYVAAKKLGIAGTGTGLVEVRSINPRSWNKSQQQTVSQNPNRSPISSSSTLFIQAGAFASQHNANQLQKRLLSLFPNKSIQLAKNSQDQLFRVRIGPISSVEEADRIAQTISDNGHPTPQVIIE